MMLHRSITSKVRSYWRSFTGTPGHHTDATLIWLLDNTASQSDEASNLWTAEFVAAFFAKSTGEDLSREVADISSKLGIESHDKDKAERTIQERLAPFFDIVLQGQSCQIELGRDATPTPSRDGEERLPSGSSIHTLNPSDANGISTEKITISGDYKDGDVLNSCVLGSATCVPSRTTFASNKNWGILSDIDDTIKRTLTYSATGILRTTFIEDPQPIAGMPEFYRHMKQELDNPPFWYVSASPYNLYSFLHSFRDKYYPAGTMLLRHASWQNLAGFVSSLSKGTQGYKVEQFKQIHENFPERAMVCLGDSTQSDPESYAEMYKAAPNWIKAIFIRKVTHVTELSDILPGDQEKERNSDKRFAKAFEGVPKGVWYVFSDPQELYGKLEALKGTL